jgi:branched-chain amino acid transport system substrate-binding protein
MTLSRRAVLGAALGSLAVTAGGCARPADPATGGGDARTPLSVGFLWTRTGDKLKVAESTRYEQGLRIGLSWVTNRTDQIGVRTIRTLKADDKGSPDVAAAAAEDLIAKGCRILAGGFTGPVALRLAEVAARRKVLFIPAMATSDALTGINKYTFRDGPSETQLLMAVKGYVRPGGRLVVLATGPGPRTSPRSGKRSKRFAPTRCTWIGRSSRPGSGTLCRPGSSRSRCWERGPPGPGTARWPVRSSS